MAFKQDLSQIKTDTFSLAKTYYGIVLAMNDQHLPPKELDLLAFTAVRGKINTHTAKMDFSDKYDSTLSSINNMISRLTRKGYFVKNQSIISVNPQIMPGFNEKPGFILSLKCLVGEKVQGTDS